jgi:hypothetical protein
LGFRDPSHKRPTRRSADRPGLPLPLGGLSAPSRAPRLSAGRSQTAGPWRVLVARLVEERLPDWRSRRTRLAWLSLGWRRGCCQSCRATANCRGRLALWFLHDARELQPSVCPLVEALAAAGAARAARAHALRRQGALGDRGASPTHSMYPGPPELLTDISSAIKGYFTFFDGTDLTNGKRSRGTGTKYFDGHAAKAARSEQTSTNRKSTS